MEPSPSSPPSSPPEILDLDSIKALKILGKGATGTVFLAHDVVSTSSSSSPFAVKLVPKSSASSLRRARWEIEVLRRLSVDSNQNPFLPRLLASFESPEYFAWAVPYCSGGDLNVLRPPFIPLRDDGELTVGGFDIREHFEKLRTTPSSAPPSPLRSPPHVCRKNDPFIEF
ncbi:unnamed protein product [Arabidopsis thaliana]|uniref:non-specific serine/threonine protein kinase n=1 Tax=Arabidopsis thaliana TaxID=3702 RepID=A0A7G2ERH5_ARATH|nr:unnamed protein product [Arabidopsis thaliana]